MPMARTWLGMGVQEKVHRAAGRAAIAMGAGVAVETKRVTHVVTGTLRRSVHAAPVDYDGSSDLDAATTADLLTQNNDYTETLEGPAVQVGSWLPYACVEWVGRMHPGVTQGLEAMRGARMDAIVRAAFREEMLI